MSRVAIVLLVLTLGCASKQPTPIVNSSAGAAGYALGYPEALTGASATLVQDMTQASLISQKLRGRASDLKPGADPKLVLFIVEQSDAAGRGEAFASAHADEAALRDFWEDERAPLSGRVSGAAQKQVTEAGCTTPVEVGGAVSYALKEGVDRQLEKRLRAHNEAHRTIERNKVALGQGNVSVVQKLADDVAMASYLVNSALVEDRDRVQRMMAEQGDVDSTLEDAIEYEREWQTQTPTTGADLKASLELVASLEKSRAAIPAAAASGESALKDINVEIEAARKNYQTALETLQDTLGAQPAPPPAKP